MSIQKFLKDHLLIVVPLVLMVGILFYFNLLVGVLGLILALVVLNVLYNEIENEEKRKLKSIEELYKDFDSSAQDAIFNMPFPLMLTDDNGFIKWYNPSFLRLIGGDSIVGMCVDELSEDFSFESLEEVDKKGQISIGDTEFLLYNNKVEKTNGEIIHLFYFVDNTKYQSLMTDYKNNEISFGHIYIDNYDEIGRKSKGPGKSIMMARIDTEVMNYFNDKGGVVRKYDDERYLVIVNRHILNEMREDRFQLLQSVKDNTEEEGQAITLSIGMSDSSNKIQSVYELSRSAIDLALSRGGDQAVIMTEDGPEFFGGASQIMEKRTRVRARVIGNTLKTLIENHERVFIMGHKNPDMDAIGSAIGVLGVVRRLGSEGYIVLNDINPSIKLIMEAFEKEQPESLEYVINSEKAIDMARQKLDLIILLDNHTANSAEEPELLTLIDNLVIIDHHRKTANAIDDVILSYIEPYASSTCELVTEMLEFIEPERSLTKFESEALMAGIVVDTKNFSFQTGVRTFEAASVLRRSGADMTSVMKYFDDNYEAVKSRARVIETSQMIKGEIAIGRLEERSDMSILVAAQSADELLSIQGVKASFVLSYAKDYIHISGRSTGEVSVQLMLEKLGGGGHLVAAATQMYDCTMEEAEEQLIEAIDEYYEEMKEIEDESNTN